MVWQKVLRPAEPVNEQLSLREFFAAVEHESDAGDAFSLAVAGGLRARTPGQAFLAGYQAALRALYPQAPKGIGALCATEGRNLRPSQIETRYSQGVVSGRKGFLLAEEQAEWALVAAREEAEGEPVRLAMLLLTLPTEGVSVEAGKPLGVIPDVPHGVLLMTQATAQRLPGDGWDDYAKPFRSLEDLYVHSAFLAWLSARAQQFSWPQNLQLRLFAGLLAAQQLVGQSPNAALMHVQLAALLAEFAALHEDVEHAFAQSPEAWAQLWARDKSILQLAGAARAARLEKALQQLRQAQAL